MRFCNKLTEFVTNSILRPCGDCDGILPLVMVGGVGDAEGGTGLDDEASEAEAMAVLDEGEIVLLDVLVT